MRKKNIHSEMARKEVLEYGKNIPDREMSTKKNCAGRKFPTPPHFSQLWYVPFSKFNLRITACYVTRLF